MNESWGVLWIPWVLFLAGAIAVLSLGVARLWARRHDRPVNSLVTHGVMAALSLAAMAGLSQGELAAFGLAVGTFRWSFLLLIWAVPTFVLGLPQLLGRRHRAPEGPFSLSPGQTILRVWLVASVAEELLTRGLIQTSLASLSEVGFSVGAHFVSLPVLAGAAAFSAMHLVLVKRMGVRTFPILVVTLFLGCVAGIYREATGSLVPAVLVHGLFNIGGSLASWTAAALGSRRHGRRKEEG